MEYNSGKLKLADLEKAVNDAGYEVIDERAVIRVGGMVCAMCVKALEIAPQKLDCMVDASVNLAAEKAYVTYNPRMTSLADIKKAVENAGYQHLGVAGEDLSPDLEKATLEKDLLGKSAASS